MVCETSDCAPFIHTIIYPYVYIYICMYVCMYVCMYIYIYVCGYKHLYAHVRKRRVDATLSAAAPEAVTSNLR